MKNPPRRKCSICNDDTGKLTNQYCLDNPKHPNYKFDCWDGLTYLDCWNFNRSNETEEEWQERIKNYTTDIY